MGFTTASLGATASTSCNSKLLLFNTLDGSALLLCSLLACLAACQTRHACYKRPIVISSIPPCGSSPTTIHSSRPRPCVPKVPYYRVLMSQVPQFPLQAFKVLRRLTFAVDSQLTSYATHLPLLASGCVKGCGKLPNGGPYCMKCPTGTYSPGGPASSTVCKACPTGWTTTVPGATAETSCTSKLCHSLLLRSNYIKEEQFMV